jgi:hypothetical protein
MHTTIHADLAAMLATIRALALLRDPTPAPLCEWDCEGAREGLYRHRQAARYGDDYATAPDRVTFRCRTPEGSIYSVQCVDAGDAMRALADRLTVGARAFGIKRARPPAKRGPTAGKGYSVACALLADGDRAGALHAIDAGAFFGRAADRHAPQVLYSIGQTLTGPDGARWHVARRVGVNGAWRILHERSGLSACDWFRTSADAIARFELAVSDASEQGYSALWMAAAAKAADYCQAGARAAWCSLADAPEDERAALAAYDAAQAIERAKHAPAPELHQVASVAAAPQQVPEAAPGRTLVGELAPHPAAEEARASAIVRALLPAIGQACAAVQRSDRAPALVRSEARRLDASAGQLQAAGAHQLAAGTRRAAELMREHAAAIEARAGTRPPDRPPGPSAGPWHARRRPARPDRPPGPRRPAWRPPWPACGPVGPRRARGTPWRLAWPHHRAPPDPWPHAHRAALAAWRPPWRLARPSRPATMEKPTARAPPDRGKRRPLPPAVEKPTAAAPRRRGKIRPFTAPRTCPWPADTPTGTNAGPSTRPRAKRGTSPAWWSRSTASRTPATRHAAQRATPTRSRASSHARTVPTMRRPCCGA